MPLDGGRGLGAPPASEGCLGSGPNGPENLEFGAA